MAEFLTGAQLNSELERIFEEANEQLIIISPFIKMHPRIKDCLLSKKEYSRLEITVVFGKNENDKSKSLSEDEFKFLKEFPNIEIKYAPRLHAKYYANESSAILSSMNLYDYSQNNNIEFGILTRPKVFNISGQSLDKDAYVCFDRVIENSERLYLRSPRFEKKYLGMSEKYIGSEIEVDNLSKQFGYEPKVSKSRASETGFCIRTGVRIQFDIERPFSDRAFRSWNKFKEENYPEKYCHYSGEESNGETSFAKPILRKNWNKAKGK